jgi:Uncharacterized alpha/beta hydrolase domain (DUF2235)
MPKNIVLLSDGTGNSSAQLLKTNVWRVYEALQLTDPSKQVACYDDGVGTSSFKPLALLGGVFGVGLARNVLRLYRFLCEHYDPGDQIYLFGFSRGAFTIRVLVGLICDQGIVKTRPTMPVAGATPGPVVQELESGERTATASGAKAAAATVGPYVFGGELVRMSRWAYRDFRKQFNQTGGLVSLARKLRNVLLGGWEAMRGLPAYDRTKNHQVDEIKFVGLWDTVDAYGLPIDELTDGIDLWVWPLSMPELELSKKVKRACHVLALDDERNTFHPVLWDESEEPQDKARITEERISQVWFAGMHSNVGGGYPDDALAHVSFTWMTEQAGRCGIHFVPELLDHHTAKADPLGRLYDSRSGLKGYYRYNPRRIKWLTNGQEHEKGFFGLTPKKPTVTIERPKIHESVFARMAAAPEGYAPIVLPDRYAVVMTDGRILEGKDNPYEPPEAASRRAEAQEAAWDRVWLKRLVYFATVAVSLGLLLRPLGWGAEEASRVAEWGGPHRAIAFVGGFLPSYASPWVNYYRANPWHLAIGLAAVLLLMNASKRLQGSICGIMRGIWLKVIPPATGQYESLERPRSLLQRVRSHRWYLVGFAVLRRGGLSTVFGIAALVCLAAAANRAAFETINAMGGWCHGKGAAERLEKDVPSDPLTFASDEACQPTGVQLEARAKYRIALTLPDKTEWSDASVQVGSPAGFTIGSPGLTWGQRALFGLSFPFRRLWSAHWFVPIARIGARGADQYPLESAATELTARTSGELLLFVNDAILPIGFKPLSLGWSSYYKNNEGQATVVVTKLEDAPPMR